ncbi:MAG: hypothetical protein IK117_11280 [Bacteroidales bacterium]|nr:hypothetical protein [Bacteroidales bacterium]
MNLKRAIFLIFSVFVLSDAFSQQIEFGGMYSYCGWYGAYRNSYGYSLSYHWNNNNQKRRSVVLSHYMSSQKYTSTNHYDYDPITYSYSINTPSPFNQRFAFRYMKTWNVLKKDDKALWLGYTIGMDLFYMHERDEDFTYDSKTDTLIWHSKGEYKGFGVGYFGIGPVLEYEFSPKTLDNLSFSFRFNPEINHMVEFLWWLPIPGYWLNCVISTKYSFPAKTVQ